MNSQPIIIVHNLIIEVTRRCNMHCQHCLRGDAQEFNMPEAYIDQLLKSVDQIDSVTFTGGEPSLNTDIIKYFFDHAKFANKFPKSFYVATNGHENQPELAHVLLEAYMDCDDPEGCGISLSIDDMHDKYQSDYVRGLAFYQPFKEHQGQDPETWVIAAGRALEFGFGREQEITKSFIAERTQPQNADYVEITIDMLYLATTGFLYPDCDLTYQIMDRNKNLKLSQLRTYMYEFTDETSSLYNTDIITSI